MNKARQTRLDQLEASLGGGDQGGPVEFWGAQFPSQRSAVTFMRKILKEVDGHSRLLPVKE
jgi:hypothetical protein